MLKLGYTLRFAWDDLVMTHADQQPRHQHRDAKGLLDASLLYPALVCAQPTVRLQRAVDLFHQPPALVRSYHLARAPLGQSGHQKFRRLRAQAPPPFTQNHCDIIEVPQTQAGVLHPDDFAALGAPEAGPPEALRVWARPRRYPGVASLLLDRFPCPSHGEANAPPPGRIVDAPLLDPLALVLGPIGRIAFHAARGGPRGWCNRQDRLPAQCMVRVLLWRALGANEATDHQLATPVPVDAQQGEAETKNPGLLLAWAPWLGHRMRRASLRLLTAIAHARPPLHQPMDMPRARLQQTTETPDRDRDRCPASPFFQGLPPWVQAWPEDPPTQDEAMTALPDAGHPATPDRDTKGHRRAQEQSQPSCTKGGGSLRRAFLRSSSITCLFRH